MIAKRTPGPWRWVHVDGEFHSLVGPDGAEVHSDGSAGGEYRPDIDVLGPDAQLIAAAPELADALERANGCIRGLLAQTPVRDVAETLAEIETALRKAGRLQ